MNKNQKHSIERIGRSIYPLRVFGFILCAISILLSQSELGTSHDVWCLIGLGFCFIYPHVAFFRYLKNEQREIEITHMQVDMLLLGLISGLVSFNPAVCLPYIIANSAANYALRGKTLVIQGLLLTATSATLITLLRPQPIVLEAAPIELIAPFLYMAVVTHYMGYLAFIRGVSLIRRKKEAESIAKLDFLTGLNNRRSLFDIVKLHDTEQKESENENDTTIIMADIDHFKQINDTYGHDHGDAVLVTVSSLIKNSVRGTDVVCRWGGEEFLVLLTDTTIEDGTSVAEVIREAITMNSIEFDGIDHRVSMTLGVASYGAESNFEETIKRADKALYEGKENGRDRVVAYTEDKKAVLKLQLSR